MNRDAMLSLAAAVDLSIEADGDPHIALQDATGDAPRMSVTPADRHGVDLVFELPRLVPAESIRRQDRSPKRKTAEKHRNKTVAFHLRSRVAPPLAYARMIATKKDHFRRS